MNLKHNNHDPVLENDRKHQRNNTRKMHLSNDLSVMITNDNLNGNPIKERKSNRNINLG